MNCVRCGKPIFRAERASTISSARGVLAWGPKCAVIAGLVKLKKRGPLITARRSRRAKAAPERAGQIDWVDEMAATP